MAPSPQTPQESSKGARNLHLIRSTKIYEFFNSNFVFYRQALFDDASLGRPSASLAPL